MKILFIVPYPLGLAPSQRFRFEQYFQILQDAGHTIRVESFLDADGYFLLSSSGNAITKVIKILSGFWQRLRNLPMISVYDRVFIHREAAPIGPPVFEWFIAHVFKKKIIYDFDDAIWLTDRKSENSLLRFLKCRWKVKYICGWSYKTSCGNEYLRSFSMQFNPSSVLNPTTVDTSSVHNPDLYTRNAKRQIVIGWTGSSSTLKYLEGMEAVLREIGKRNENVSFLVIADRQPRLQVEKLKFRNWTTSTEVADLTEIDIGLMPLPNDTWAQGKCGFKLLQYMAMGIPSVASPVGANQTIVHVGSTGFLASGTDEWISNLEKLIHDEELRSVMGKLSREQVIKRYSVASNVANFLSLFE